MERGYQGLKRDGSTTQLDIPLYQFQAFSSLMGFGAVSEFDKKVSAMLASELDGK